ncbi:dicarboxylate/amino acid:cation symporter [Acinetobacter sp. WU_MDCI_Axc73]|nr:dicarboxylate/amino acid:cation symporter [Acinetobacter sp. WU_MDCI_Axc73]
MKKLKLHHLIFIAMILGAIFGSLTSTDGYLLKIPILGFYTLLGDLFLNALKMIVIPLIMLAIVNGMISVGQDDQIGRLGIKTVAFYLISCFIAVFIGLAAANLFTPGIVNGVPAKDMLGLAASTGEVLQRVEGRSIGDFSQIILQFFPANLVKAALENQLLGLIIFALLCGYFLNQMQGKAAQTLKDMVNASYDVIMKITMLIISFAPIGVFGLIAAIVTRTGFEALQPLAWFFVTVVFALFIHAFVVSTLAVKVLTRLSPVRLIQAMFPALLTAFSSASSAASLPVNMECAQNRAGISKRVTSFMMPLGATINMNGTALYECVAVIFIAQAYGMQLSLMTQFFIVVAAVLTSIGVAAVPAASLVAITLILTMVGLPAEAIGLILVTDRILDMFRTSVNMWGDAIGATIIGHSEGEKDILSLPVDQMEEKQLKLQAEEALKNA